MTIYTELTGLYPSFRTDPVTHERVAVNGGLPQLVNLTAHLALWRDRVLQLVPDLVEGPVVGLDWEAWEPWWEGNNARPMGEPGQEIFQNKSIELVRQQHPAWPHEKVLSEAKRQFNVAAREFWTQTFAVGIRI